MWDLFSRIARSQRSRRSKWAFRQHVSAVTQPERLEARTLLSIQSIASNAPRLEVTTGQTFEVPIVYQTRNTNGGAEAFLADKLNFNIHYNSNQLDFVDVTSVFQEGLQTTSFTSVSESHASVIGDDNDNNTDMAIVASYEDTDATAGWPNDLTSAGQTLFVARFRAKPEFNGTHIRFSANEVGTIEGTNDEFTFESTELEVLPPSDPTISIANPDSVNEGQSHTFTVSLTPAATEVVTIDWTTENGNGPTGALAGEDYTAASGTVTFQPGDTQATFTVDTIDDSIIDPNETYDVTLSNPSGAILGPRRATAGIIDNDDTLPRVSISNAPEVGEGGASEFTVTLSVASDISVTVDFETRSGTGPTAATNGVDFTSQVDTLTFLPGETTKPISISTIDDVIAEGQEQFVVVLTDASGATIFREQGEGRINDNDSGLPLLRIANAAAVTEGAEASFVVTLSEAAESDVTVSYSTSSGHGPTGATDGVDYVGQSNRTLTFEAGQTEKTINISTTDDVVEELVEEFFVTLSDAMGASIDRARGTGTIEDNDGELVTPGDVDKDDDFDSNDAFLILLQQFDATDEQFDSSKGSSNQTANEIRTNADAIGLAGDVDGDSDFDANDAYLILLYHFSANDAQINGSKGSSQLTPAQIRANVDALGDPVVVSSGDGAQSQVQSDSSDDGQSGDGGQSGGGSAASSQSDGSSQDDDLFSGEEGNTSTVSEESDETAQSSDSPVWDEVRGWIDSI